MLASIKWTFSGKNVYQSIYNSYQIFIIYVPSQQLQGQLRTKHSNNNNVVVVDGVHPLFRAVQ
jgi:hypothetical protein